MNPLLAALSNVVPWSVAYDPLAGFLFAGLFAVALLAVFVEVFVRAAKPRSAMAGRKTCLAAVAVFAALGALHAAGFVAFAYRAKALYGGWPPTFAFYDRMQPWTAFFERSEGVLVLAGLAAGLLAFAASVAVFAGWRRNAARAVFRALAALAASAFLAFYLPLLLLPEAAVNWWFD